MGIVMVSILVAGLAGGIIVSVGHAQDTPLPNKLVIVAPDAAVPPQVSGFSGKWTGSWEGMLDSALIVTKIYPAQKGGWRADVVYSWGTNYSWRIREPGYREFDADFKDGALVIQSGSLLTIKYRLSDDGKTLEGLYNAHRGDYKGIFQRAADK